MKIANTYHQSILRGGRLRKTARGIVTYAPWLGTASALALGTLLALGGESLAGSCTETPANSGNWVCSDAKNSADDGMQDLRAQSGQSLVITDTVGFGIDVASGHAFKLTGARNSANVTANLDGNITAEDSGVWAFHKGNDALNITIAAITSGEDGIWAKTRRSSTNGMTIVANGPIDAKNHGIRAMHYGGDALTITVNSSGSITAAGGNGIFAKTSSRASTMTIEARAAITTNASDKHAIRAIHEGTGAVSIDAANATGISITTEGNISTSTGKGISASHQGSGALDITANGKVNSNAGNGIHAATGSGTSELTITANSNITSTNGKGIAAYHGGSDALVITLGPDATIKASSTGNGHGIHADTFLNTTTDILGGLIITANGDIGASDSKIGKDGIHASHRNKGDLTITTADIHAMEDGIYSYLGLLASGMRVTANGDIDAGQRGIDIAHWGNSGDLTITAKGAITAGNEGIRARIINNGNIAITTEGAITAGNEGIYIAHQGVGAFTIRANGNISARNKGIRASHRGGAFVIIANGDINAGNRGISAGQGGDGMFTITTNGDIDSGNEGISASHRGVGTFTITANGATTAQQAGIYARHYGRGSLDITVGENGSVASTSAEGIYAKTTTFNTSTLTITANGPIDAGGNGIAAYHDGKYLLTVTVASIDAEEHGIYTKTGDASSGMILTVNGAITANGYGESYHGVYAYHYGTGDLSITVASGASVSGSTGIYAHHNGSNGGIVIDVSGTVSSTEDDSDAIIMEGGTTQRLRLRPGFSIATGDTVEASRTDAILELTADAGQTETFDLSSLSAFTNFANLDKTGVGAWTLTGEQPEDKAFTSATITAGTLRLNDAIFRPGSSFTIPADNTLEVTGANNTIHAALDMSNSASNLSLSTTGDSTATNDRLTVSSTFTAGGKVNLDVDLANGAADRLVLEGGVSGSASEVILHATGSISNPTLPARALIAASGTSNANDFTEGKVMSGVMQYDFTLNHASGNWTLSSIDESSGTLIPTATSHGGYAPTLAELSAPPSTQRRLGEAYWGGEAEGTVVQQQNLRATLQPGVNIGGTRSELTDERLAFGFTMPVGNVILGADMWQSLAKSHVSSTAGSGEIGVESHAGALSAAWFSPNGFYVDAQTQYIVFTSNLAAQHQSLAFGNDGTGTSATAELGYRLAVPISPAMILYLAPQAQLSWSRIDFDDFTDSNGLSVSLEDGDTMTGRFGIAWDGTWEHTGGSGRLYGGINLHEPLDGKVGVNISGTSIASEQQDTAFDTNLGIGYNWQNGYSMNLEAGAIRRDEATEYRANLGLKIEF